MTRAPPDQPIRALRRSRVYMESSAIARTLPTAISRGRKGRRGSEQASSRERDIIVKRRGESVLEHFRRIYLAIQPIDTGDIMPVIGVTSSVEGEGRSTIAAGIAAAMAA